jgi:hypothetical protein
MINELEVGQDHKNLELKTILAEVQQFMIEHQKYTNEELKAAINSYLKYIKKHRSAREKKMIRKFFKMKAPPSSKHKGREAIDWKGCPQCTRDSKHYARGLCSVCYRRLKRRGELENSELKENDGNISNDEFSL